MATARKRKLAIRLGTAAAALAVTLAAHARLPARELRETEAFLPDPSTARLGAFGFESLAADYYWLRAVQIVGSAQGDPSVHAPQLAALTELVVALDPWVDHPYRFAALWLSERPDTIEAASRMLERGIAYHPGEWRNRLYLSFNRFFYLGDAQGAALELEPAVGLPGAPRYLGRLLARLRSEGGDLEAAAAYLETMRENAPDEWHRVEYEKALDEIETERRARLLDEARKAFRQRAGRDIASVRELAFGPDAVTWQLPPEPHGWEWEIDERSGEIVSSYYGRRYRLHFQAQMGGIAETGR